MTEIELYNELQNVEGCLKILDSQISELRKKKNDIMNDFLSLLPFQEGDKVKDKDGNIFIIECLKDAFSIKQEDMINEELPDIDVLIKELSSDEFIEKKIKDILGDDVAELKEE